MKGLALITAIIFLIVNSGCAYTQKSIIKENSSSVNVSKDSKQSSEEDYFIAKKGSILFHKPNCKCIRAKGYLFDSEGIIIFKSSTEALRANYTPCPLCKPYLFEDETKKEERGWFAVILGILGLGFLTSSSVSASFSGGEGLMIGITNE